MKTSNIELLSEIDKLEAIEQVAAENLEVVKRIEQLENCLNECANKMEGVLLWDDYVTHRLTLELMNDIVDDMRVVANK